MTVRLNSTEDRTASQIQDMLIERVKTLGIFKSLFDTPMETWAPGDLPAIAVYLVDETMDSDGNAGPPHFLHSLTIGIHAVVVSSDAKIQRDKVVAALASIDQVILTDPPTLMPIERVQRIQRKFKFERVAETPTAEVSSTITLQFRSTWPPLVPDDYLVLHVTTQFPVGGDPASVEQVIAQFDIIQNPPESPASGPILLPMAPQLTTAPPVLGRPALTSPP